MGSRFLRSQCVGLGTWLRTSKDHGAGRGGQACHCRGVMIITGWWEGGEDLRLEGRDEVQEHRTRRARVSLSWKGGGGGRGWDPPATEAFGSDSKIPESQD